MERIKKHTISIKHALDGLLWALSTQPNYAIHLLLGCVSLFLGYYLKISPIEWLVIIQTIMIGLVIETINTSIEAATDAIDRSIRDDIKIAKDVAAAAMLLYAIGAVVLGAIIFIPKLLLTI